MEDRTEYEEIIDDLLTPNWSEKRLAWRKKKINYLNKTQEYRQHCDQQIVPSCVDDTDSELLY